MKLSTIAKSLLLFVFAGSMSVANAQFGNLLKDLEKAAKDLEKGIQQGGSPTGDQKQGQSESSNTQNDPALQREILQLLGGVTWSQQHGFGSSHMKHPCNDSRIEPDAKRDHATQLVLFKAVTSGIEMTEIHSNRGSRNQERKMILDGFNKDSEQNIYTLTGVYIQGPGERVKGRYETKVRIDEEKVVILSERYTDPNMYEGKSWLQQTQPPAPLIKCSQEQLANLAKTNQQLSEERAVEQQRFASSPEGIKKKLQENYFFFMLAQDCHEARKSMVLKYVDPNTFNRVRSAMKTIESKAKSEGKDLNTDAVWKAAAKEYSSSQLGEAMELSKRNPQKHIKEIQDSCTLAVNLILSEVPKEGPKKSF